MSLTNNGVCYCLCDLGSFSIVVDLQHKRYVAVARPGRRGRWSLVKLFLLQKTRVYNSGTYAIQPVEKSTAWRGIC